MQVTYNQYGGNRAVYLPNLGSNGFGQCATITTRPFTDGSKKKSSMGREGLLRAHFANNTLAVDSLTTNALLAGRHRSVGGLLSLAIHPTDTSKERCGPSCGRRLDEPHFCTKRAVKQRCAINAATGNSLWRIVDLSFEASDGRDQRQVTYHDVRQYHRIQFHHLYPSAGHPVVWPVGEL